MMVGQQSGWIKIEKAQDESELERGD